MKPTLIFATLFGISSIVYAQTKDELKKQLPELNSRITKAPSNPENYYLRAEVYDNMNDFAQSNRDYRKVVSLYQQNPKNQYLDEFVKASYRLADDHFFRSGNKAEAAKYVQQGLKLAPDDEELKVIDAIISGNLPGNEEQAKEKFSKLVEEYPENMRLRLYYARFLEKNNDELLAAEQYEIVAAAQPENDEAFLALGIIYNNEAARLSNETGDPALVMDFMTKATDNFKRLNELVPGDPQVENILLVLRNELQPMQDASKKKKDPQPPY